MKPLVSVIIPFNRINFLKDAIKSVFCQSYREIEIILISDGSINSLHELELNDSRIKFFKQEKSGPSVARNLGISKSSGNYIAFLDSDDLFLPNKIEDQVKIMEKNKNILLSHSSFLYIDKKEKEISLKQSGNFSGFVYPKILLHCPIATPSVMIRKKVKELGLKFNNNIRISEDILLWSEIAKISPILGIKKPLSKIRKHDNNSSDNPKSRLIGGYNIYYYGIKKDEKLSRRFGIYSIIITHLSVSKKYLKRFEIKSFLKNIIYSLKYIIFLIINKGIK